MRRELDLRVIFEVWTVGEARMSIRSASEFHNDSGTWFRAYGSDEIALDPAGLVKQRFSVVNEHPILERERALRWPAGPRPAEHPTLLELGF